MYGSEVPFIGKEISDFGSCIILKNMLGVKQEATSVAIYGDTGRYPLFVKEQNYNWFRQQWSLHIESCV